MKSLAYIVAFLSVSLSATGSFAQSFDPSNLHLVEQGFYRSGRPSAQDLANMQKTDHIKTVIDLEDDQVVVAQESAAAKKLGINFISEPMSPMVTPNDGQMAQIQALLNDPSRRPILIHCKRGMDRTGLVIGLYRVFTEKWTPQMAYNEMLQYGFHPIFIELNRYYKTKTHMQ